jgi:hypothetical protein
VKVDHAAAAQSISGNVAQTGSSQIMRQPSGCSIGAVLGPRIEGDGGGWSSPVDCVDDHLKQRKTLSRQAHASAYYNAIVARGAQVTLYRMPCRFIGTDKADIALPSPVCHLFQRKSNTSMYCLSAHTWRQGRIGVIYRFWVEADQQDSSHFRS